MTRVSSGGVHQTRSGLANPFSCGMSRVGCTGVLNVYIHCGRSRRAYPPRPRVYIRRVYITGPSAARVWSIRPLDTRGIGGGLPLRVYCICLSLVPVHFLPRDAILARGTSYAYCPNVSVCDKAFFK